MTILADRAFSVGAGAVGLAPRAIRRSLMILERGGSIIAIISIEALSATIR
jgi:hypothetical protein